LQLESYIQTSMKPEMAELRQTAVQNQTATMLEIGSTLLNQSAEQSRKLTDVEAQVQNQTSRIEMQLQENSLSTTKLEKQLLLQTNEIHKLQNKNNILEVRVLEMETKHQAELAGARLEKEKLQRLVNHQSGTIEELEKSLLAASANTSLLQRQQLQLLESVQSLVQSLVAHGRGEPGWAGRVQAAGELPALPRGYQGPSAAPHPPCAPAPSPAPFPSLATLQHFGWSFGHLQAQAGGSSRSAQMPHPALGSQHSRNINNPRAQKPLKVEEKSKKTRQGFGIRRVSAFSPSPLPQPHCPGRSSSSRTVPRLSLQDYSGTAGQQSGLALQGTRFSTRDADNDNCLCKCAQMLSGGWWFDACGLSNLNGISYPARHNIRKLNGIRWHHFQGPSYSLKGTRMLIRPASF
ncbi:ANGP4 protein, partial [Chloroceryle aenea]|nr:ANGP4 protein [Chloroceryle aenea]